MACDMVHHQRKTLCDCGAFAGLVIMTVAPDAVYRCPRCGREFSLGGA